MCIKIKTVILKLNELRIKTEWQVHRATRSSLERKVLDLEVCIALAPPFSPWSCALWGMTPSLHFPHSNLQSPTSRGAGTLFTEHRACFSSPSLASYHNNTVKQNLPCSFYQQGNWGSERIRDLPQAQKSCLQSLSSVKTQEGDSETSKKKSTTVSRVDLVP